MTTDRQLIAVVVKLANCEKLFKPDERDVVLELVKRYESACRLSRGPDKQRAAHWSMKAFDMGRQLQGVHEAYTGKAWIDMPLITGKVQRYQ